MTEKEIQELHDELFIYLSTLQEQDSSLFFQMRRTNRFDRLNAGRWFNGNDKYIETSFWEHRDDTRQTPTMRLVFMLDDKNIKWNFELVARENTKYEPEIKERQLYFEEMVRVLGGFTKQEKPYHVWTKEVHTNGFIKGLHDFIEHEKPVIDKYIKDNPPKENIKVGFIQQKDFDKQLKRIIEARDSNEFLEGKIKQYIKDTKAQNFVFPFSITRLYVENYQGIKKLVSEDNEGNGIETDSQWIFLTGENGFGKTSILRAIAKGLIGDENEVPLTPDSAVILINGIAHNQPFFEKTQPRYLSKHNIPVVGYGVSRFLISSGDKNTEDRNQKKAYSLFKDDGQLIDIEQELITTFAYDRPRFDAIKEKLEYVLQNKVVITIDTSNGKPKVKYAEKVEEDVIKTYDKVSLGDLAAGYRSILTMIGDMVIRFASQVTDDFGELSGVALIDEIDAHLHPKYQYELPKLLSEAFPKVQFIVSTHSPIPLLGLPKDVKAVVFKVNRTFDEGITMDRLDDDIDIWRLNPNALLTSPIFGFSSLYSRGLSSADANPFSSYQTIQAERELDLSLEMKQNFDDLNLELE